MLNHEDPAYVPMPEASSCGKAVDEACNSCESPDSSQVFFHLGACEVEGSGGLWKRFRPSLRLNASSQRIQFVAFPTTPSHECFSCLPVTTDLHRFEELIGGRPYLIEVAAVSKDRWRAYIVRIPGVPTALMPFYGETPEAAAGNLRRWLTRAYEGAANGVSRV
jgi:hypothetical protein